MFIFFFLSKWVKISEETLKLIFFFFFFESVQLISPKLCNSHQNNLNGLIAPEENKTFYFGVNSSFNGVLIYVASMQLLIISAPVRSHVTVGLGRVFQTII